MKTTFQPERISHKFQFTWMLHMEHSNSFKQKAKIEHRESKIQKLQNKNTFHLRKCTKAIETLCQPEHIPSQYFQFQ